jgi:hypothetical protein
MGGGPAYGAVGIGPFAWPTPIGIDGAAGFFGLIRPGDGQATALPVMTMRRMDVINRERRAKAGINCDPLSDWTGGMIAYCRFSCNYAVGGVGKAGGNITP